MSDIPEDIMKAAKKCAGEWNLIDAIANAILAERERSRQLLSEAETREWEARGKALEEAAQVADDMPLFWPASAAHVTTVTPQDVAARIRALQSEER